MKREIALGIASILACACTLQQPSSAPQPAKPVFERTMKLSGHGMLFDTNGKQVTLTEDAIDALQTDMLVTLSTEPGLQPNPALEAIAVEAKDLLSTKKLSAVDRIAARSVYIKATAAQLPKQRRDAYFWRSDHLLAEGRALYPGKSLDATIVLLYGRTRLSAHPQTQYVEECRKGDVPIPPDFVPDEKVWTYQGSLTENMLRPGQRAEVWTWADPDRSGACVLLPRGRGVGKDLAGLICQSAKTGNACFWDNLDKQDPGRRIPWAEEPLRISQMEDATTLSPCTECHQGNNVFLVAPMDPVWCRLMRGSTTTACGPMTGANPDNFTLRVFDSRDRLDGHPRYIPLSNGQGWTNDVTTPGCSGGCHEMPKYTRREHPATSLDGIARDWMPPACRYNCYTR